MYTDSLVFSIMSGVGGLAISGVKRGNVTVCMESNKEMRDCIPSYAVTQLAELAGKYSFFRRFFESISRW